jgi:2,3-diketo-5-methylthio-1-phosphopentane phosphatase
VTLTPPADLSNVCVFVDFDGTIALEDTTDVILERFAASGWRDIEAEWLAGMIGSRDCLARQVDLVRASPEALDGVADSGRVDPDFCEFVAFCQAAGVAVMVVSDGFDRVVNRMLSRAGIRLPVRANHLRWIGGDRWTLEFPHGRAGCRSASGNCKCAALTDRAESMRVLVGDGRSDFCPAEIADCVLAKGALSQHCQAMRLNHRIIGSFAGATSLLRDAVFRRARAAEVSHHVGGSLHASLP